jgi:hypothetical protein
VADAESGQACQRPKALWQSLQRIVGRVQQPQALPVLGAAQLARQLCQPVACEATRLQCAW